MKKIKAKKGHFYAGVYRKPGTVYKVKNQDARVLIAVRMAVPYVEPPPEPKPAPKRRGRPPGSTSTRSRRTYQRKDMQAEAE
jgi:hypothetical protein